MKRRRKKKTPSVESELKDVNLYNIDEENLYEEWKSQPKRSILSLKQLALYTYRHDETVRKIKLREAQISRKIKINPKRYAVKGTSAAAIKSTLDEEIQLDIEILNLRKRLARIKYKINLLKSIIKSLEDKGKSLVYFSYKYGKANASAHMPTSIQRDLENEMTRESVRKSKFSQSD